MDTHEQNDPESEKLKKLEQDFIEAKEKLDREIRLQQIRESPTDFLFNILFLTITNCKAYTEDCFDIIKELIRKFENLDITDSNYSNTAKLVLKVKKLFKTKRKEISDHRDKLVKLAMDSIKLEKAIEKSFNDKDNKEQ